MNAELFVGILEVNSADEALQVLRIPISVSFPFQPRTVFQGYVQEAFPQRPFAQQGYDPRQLVQSVQVGGMDRCEPTDSPCNGPLEPGRDYNVRYTLFSENGEETDFPFSEQAFSTCA